MDKEKRNRITGVVVLGILPLFLAIIYCAVYGKAPWDIYLPNSYWNDELFYYKQVEGILKGGAPGGYFGYNGSQAFVLSFAVWSPLLLIPWVIWGGIFGWNFFSPILCNLLCLMAGLAAFGWLARPAKRQTVTIAVLLALFTPLTRFIFSCMPETFCCSLVLWYMGCLFACERARWRGGLWQMYLIAGFLTLMRPYFLLLFIYPVINFGREKRTRGIWAAGGGCLFALGYMILQILLSADYLFDALELPFLQTIGEQGLGAGIQEFGRQFLESARTLKDFLRAALQYGNFPGSMYAVFGVTGVIFLAVAAVEWKRRKENPYFKLAVSMAGMYTAMMAAIFFIYSLNEGGRHLMTFLLAGFLVLGMYSSRVAGGLVQVLTAAVIGFFFLVQPGSPYDRLPPFQEEVLAGEIRAMSQALQEKMEYTSRIGWENTVVWLAYDIVDGETVIEQWQQLYALPGGCGINYCSAQYVLDNLYELQARYIAAIPGGQVEELLLREGAVLLEKNEKIAVYCRTVVNE